MKANKNGISLIVLIITIVVIIILAAAIILNLSNTNIINNANKAVTENNEDEVQAAVTLKYADMYAENALDSTKTAPTPVNVAAAVASDLKLDVCASTETTMDAKDHYEVDASYNVTFVEAVEAEEGGDEGEDA